jgi:hypothetical protein
MAWDHAVVQSRSPRRLVASAVIGFGLAILTAACGSTKTVTKTVTVTGAASVPPREFVFYGHVKSLERKGGGFELRVDPALWLGGLTANRAAVEDKAIAPGNAVPNDYYIVDEGHRLLTYRMPAGARVTVLTYKATVRGTPITVPEYADLLAGRNPKPLRLFEPQAGFWIRVVTDTVRSLDQQYQP